MKKTTTLEGALRISRWTSNGNPNTGITISLHDELSGTECVEIHISVEQLGLALTNSQVKCQFEWRPTYVGMKSEHKDETVPFDCYSGQEDKAAQAKAVKPFEVDGWMCSNPSDLTNHHRNAGKGLQRVGFTRFVKP